MLKRFVAVACTVMVGAALFVASTGCEKKATPPATPATPPAETPPTTPPAEGK
jgi:hypothetical protein